MEKVIAQYTAAMDELNVLTQASYEQADGEDTQVKVNQIADDVLSFLIHAYTMGMEHASLMLAHDLTVDIEEMHEAIYLIIEGKTFEDRVADHVIADDLSG
jgi:hypothetical protein